MRMRIDLVTTKVADFGQIRPSLLVGKLGHELDLVKFLPNLDSRNPSMLKRKV